MIRDDLPVNSVSVALVPEPSVSALMGAGLAALALLRRRRVR